MNNTVTLEKGILKTCFEKVRKNFYENIDPKKHAETYFMSPNNQYAEPEFTGKYLDICAYFYETEKSKVALNNAKMVIESIKSYINEDGYLGCLEKEFELRAFSVWNHSFTVYGLARMYEVTKDPEIGALAEKAAGWILNVYADCTNPDILNATNEGSENLTTIFSIIYMYKVTGDKKYSEFVKKVLAHCENTDMNLISFDNLLNLRSKKGIEMLVVFLGVLYYGQLLNDENAVNAAKRYWQNIKDTQIRNTGNGTIKEHWTEGGNAPRFLPTEEKPNETCVAVGWMELSLALFYSEQDPKYLDAIEKTLFNHLIGSFDNSGEDFAYYQGNYGKKIFRTNEGYYQCCRYRGFTIFSYLKEYLYYLNNDIVIPMIYTESKFVTDELSIEQHTDYPKSGEIVFEVQSKKDYKLLLRIPDWCKNYSILVNSNETVPEIYNGFLKINISKGNTKIELNFATKVEKTKNVINNKNYLSFNYGPLLLALDSHYGNSIEDCIDENSAVEKIAVEGEESLVRFKTDGINLIDFASAGTINPDKDLYTVYIKAK